jgi:hypothetical protein
VGRFLWRETFLLSIDADRNPNILEILLAPDIVSGILWQEQ